MTGPFTGYLHPYYTYTWLVPKLVIYIPITHIHDWSLYWLFTSLLHIYITGLFTGYLHPYYTYYMTVVFAGYLHPYYTYCMTGLFTGYLHPYYTYT